ncbi:unnamed protein product [Rotaria sp. Silwood1]|nr:unnamed protein product [Rotaria sp. Silwood1]
MIYFLGYLPPHRNQVSNHLKDLYNFHLTALKEQLQNIDYIGLTFDFWTSRRCVSFLCITGHWFDDKCVYFSKVIHFSSFDERHTGFNISRSVKEKLESLGIYHKVVAITCDGGENLVSACSQLDGSIKRIWCCTHRLHLVIINSLGFWNTENKLDNNPTNCLTTEITATATSSSNIISNNQQELMDTSCSDENETGEILIDETIGDAGGHYTDIINNFDTAQGSEAESATIVNAESIDDEQNLDLIDDNWSSNIDTNVPTTNEVELIMDLLKKCRVIATLSKKSSIVSNFIRTNQLLFKVNRTLNNDCKSRWNSTFILLDALIDLKPVMMKLFNEKRTLNLRRVQIEKLTMIELNNEDWDFISSLHSVLKPFYWGTVMMSGKNYPSIGLAYHAVHKIKHFCTNGNSSNNHIKELKKLLLTKLYTYFFDDIEQFQYFQRHAFFDPAAHLSLSDVEKNQCEKYVKNLIYDDVYPKKHST